jgi:hypothetical protein
MQELCLNYIKSGNMKRSGSIVNYGIISTTGVKFQFPT